jgi:hypothetical protein
MGSNAFIDIAIGLILMFLVLSMLTTVINEFIATQMKLRASMLADSLKQMLDNDDLRDEFYKHGLISSANNAVGGNDGHVSYLSGRTFALAVLGSLDTKKSLPGFDDIKTAIEKLPTESKIRGRLLAQLATANGDLEKLRDNLARSFDNMMDRITGVYKRYLKWISLTVGLVLAIALNADTIAVGTALWKDGSLRAEMVEAAGSFKTPPPAGGGNVDLSQAAQAIKKAQQDLRPLPIGWEGATWPPTWSQILSWASLVKVFGWLLTGLAISLGAPFWFDLLGKFMNLRGAGTKPERTPPAPAQAPAAPAQAPTAPAQSSASS